MPVSRRKRLWRGRGVEQRQTAFSSVGPARCGEHLRRLPTLTPGCHSLELPADARPRARTPREGHGLQRVLSPLGVFGVGDRPAEPFDELRRGCAVDPRVDPDAAIRRYAQSRRGDSNPGPLHYEWHRIASSQSASVGANSVALAGLESGWICTVGDPFRDPIRRRALPSCLGRQISWRSATMTAVRWARRGSPASRSPVLPRASGPSPGAGNPGRHAGAAQRRPRRWSRSDTAPLRRE